MQNNNASAVAVSVFSNMFPGVTAALKEEGEEVVFESNGELLINKLAFCSTSLCGLKARFNGAVFDLEKLASLEEVGYFSGDDFPEGRPVLVKKIS